MTALSLAAVTRALAEGTASPLEVLERCLARLADAQAHGAFVAVDEAGARRVRGRANREPRRVVGLDGGRAWMT